MPTRAIPAGTCNGSVNTPIPLWRDFCRLAAMRGMSAGALARELMEREVAAARARGIELIRDARQTVLPWAACVLIGLGVLSAIAGAALGGNELRRPRVGRPPLTVRVPSKATRLEDLT